MAEAPAGGAKLRELDIAAMLETDPPPVPYLAEPLLVRRCLTMLAGREGQGKSWVALALAIAGGHGAPVVGIDCRRGLTLYVDGENGEHEAHRRLQHARGAQARYLTYVEASGFHLQRDLYELRALVERHEPDLVVLDSFRALWPDGDENDSAADEPVRRAVTLLARRTGAAVLLLHHAGKAGLEYRGSTAIGGAVELGFTLRRHEEDPDARQRREIVCWKSRPATEPEPLWLRLEHDAARCGLAEAEPFDGVPSVRPAPVRDALVERGTTSTGRQPDEPPRSPPRDRPRGARTAPRGAPSRPSCSRAASPSTRTANTGWHEVAPPPVPPGVAGSAHHPVGVVPPCHPPPPTKFKAMKRRPVTMEGEMHVTAPDWRSVQRRASRTRAWRLLPPTDAQLKVLRRIALETGEPVGDVTRGRGVRGDRREEGEDAGAAAEALDAPHEGDGGLVSASDEFDAVGVIAPDGARHAAFVAFDDLSTEVTCGPAAMLVCGDSVVVRVGDETVTFRRLDGEWLIEP